MMTESMRMIRPCLLLKAVRKEREMRLPGRSPEWQGSHPREPDGHGTWPGKLISVVRNGFRRCREDVFCRWEKGGYLSHEGVDLIMNTVVKRPLPGPVDSVALERGDRTATESVFPADTGKTDHQKDSIILSLLYKFPYKLISDLPSCRTE